MLSRGAVGRSAGRTSEPPQGVGPGPARATSPSWYDVTWNPTVGCSPIGRGCDHCEALRTVIELARMGGKGGARYAGLTTAAGRTAARWTGELRELGDVLTWPLLQRRGRRILVNSLSDLFHEKLTTETIDGIHAVMTIAHWHRFLMLTRRADRMRAYYVDPQTPARIAARIRQLAATVLPALGFPARARGSSASATPFAAISARRNWAAGLGRVVRQELGSAEGDTSSVTLEPWPLPNLWLGVSVEDQDRAGRIWQLLQTPATSRWVCFEPLLGPVRPDLVPAGDGSHVDALLGGRFAIDGRGRRSTLAGPALSPVDWVMAGGETGIGARGMDADWVRDLRDRCAVSGVPFFFKQWGEWAPVSGDAAAQKPLRRGRRAAGRLIDGRSWDEMPPAMRERTRRPQ